MAQTLNMHTSKAGLPSRPLPRGDFIPSGTSSEREFLTKSIAAQNLLASEARLFINTEETNLREMLEKQGELMDKQEKIEMNVKDIVNSIQLIKRKRNAMIVEAEKLLDKRKEIVDTIKPEDLAKLKFKDFMDNTHDVFKWVLEAIYKESKSSYQWKNFKTQAFGKDKGADFMVRLRMTSIRKFKSGDATFGRDILNRETEILAYFEKKGKQNMSLRGLLNFIKIAVEIKEKNDAIDFEENNIKEKFAELTVKDQEAKRAGQPLKVVSENIKNSQFFMDKYQTILTYAEKCADLCQRRLVSKA